MPAMLNSGRRRYVPLAACEARRGVRTHTLITSWRSRMYARPASLAPQKDCPMHALWQDSRYAIRGLWSAHGYALIVVATIALGLSLNTTMFTVFNAYALRPLPVRDPSTLFQLSWSTPTGGSRFFPVQESDAVRAAE